jgi:hypothetical protein
MKQNRNIHFIAIVVVVVLAIFYTQYHFKNNNKKLSVSYFINQDVNPDTYMDGIDLSKPVKVFHIKKGDIFIQYQLPGAPQGNFYALEGSTPSELGINDTGYDPDLKIIKKEKQTYIATKDFDALSLYAAPIVDSLSTPINEQIKEVKLQIFSTCKLCFEQQQ